MAADSQEDSIQNEDSESMEVVRDNHVQTLIPVSNIQVVLQEGVECQMMDDHAREIRLEAERLFYIGLNLGVNSNEERFQMLDRMVDLEGRDESNFALSGGEEGYQ
ncbi:hypothetical protein TSUD_413320 [Trifolium subterraneum]|uniref:Uncharacterized protein n=1 Tax=Trifolium subterraneum TaxID=3900 RepID=A0A2Z6P4R7_TRISU|nr:hypothetical protein TSUD_413320 [Trifolium subterraneum]